MKNANLFISLVLVLSAMASAQEDYPGSIHGVLPMAAASRVSVADLQTPEGQRWFEEFQALSSLRARTEYVCRSEPQMAVIVSDGDFRFNNLPPGSYAVAACMQRENGAWLEASAVVQVEPGIVVELDFGSRPYLRLMSGSAIYIGFGTPFRFDFCFGCYWPRYSSVWWYEVPRYRCAPIVFAPRVYGPVVIGRRIVIPPTYRFRDHPEYRYGGEFRPSPHYRVYQPRYTAPHDEMRHPGWGKERGWDKERGPKMKGPKPVKGRGRP